MGFVRARVLGFGCCGARRERVQSVVAGRGGDGELLLGLGLGLGVGVGVGVGVGLG